MDGPRSLRSSPNYLKQFPVEEEKFFKKKNYLQNCDRFIPNRSAMDFGYANYMLTRPQEIPIISNYQKLLAEMMNMNGRRILAFKNKPPALRELFPPDAFQRILRISANLKPQRHIPTRPERSLDAVGLMDGYSLNLLDWGSCRGVALGLEDSVYLWDGSTSELVTFEDERGPVTSVNWAPDGRRVAVGLNNSQVELWDSAANRKLRTLSGCHRSGVGSLAWNNDILTTGGMDGGIVHIDVRIRSPIVGTYRGHGQDVCGLKWSASGQQLASGGNDRLVYIWDNRRSGQWLHKLEDHAASVRALAWCPFQGNLLASGGGGDDGCIKFWNTQTGACLNSVDTGSEVCALLWNKNDAELLSAHGSVQNQLALWKYPSMAKIAELSGHSSRVLYLSQGPDGSVASAAGDETLKIWNVFGVPEVAKPAPKMNAEPFAHFQRIR